MSALVAELADIDLGDVRLNRRARRVLQCLGEKPTLSIPSACGGWGETRAAYRLFDHAAVSAEAVLAPHMACTVERLRAHPRVLCLQDTSELDDTGKSDIQGLGPLNYESRRGLYRLQPWRSPPIGWRWAYSMSTPGCVSPAASPSPRTPLARSKRRKACAGSTASRG